jgi:hypothetical protein
LIDEAGSDILIRRIDGVRLRLESPYGYVLTSRGATSSQPKCRVGRASGEPHHALMVGLA